MGEPTGEEDHVARPSDSAARRGWYVDVPIVGPVGWPPTGSLAFLIVVGGLAALDVLSWPLATAVGIGHILARDTDHRVLREIGEGLKVA